MLNGLFIQSSTPGMIFVNGFHLIVHVLLLLLKAREIFTAYKQNVYKIKTKVQIYINIKVQICYPK